MSRRGRALVWTLWGLSLVLIATSALATFDNIGFRTDSTPIPIAVVISVAFATVGGLISGRAGNRVGWLFLTFGIFFPLAGTMDAYSFHGLVADPGSRPFAATAALIANVTFLPAALALGMIFVLFPTGRPASRRWRPVLWLSLAGAALVVIGWALRPGPINGPFNDYGVTIVNPIGPRPLAGVLNVVFAAGVGASLIGAALGVASMVVRFRTGSAAERQQIKWIAGVGVICAISFLSSFVINPVFGDQSAVSNASWLVFFTTLTLGVPVATGVAILRYRLYDIDRFISRTLSYAIVTVLLAGTFGIVVLVPTAVVGRGGHSPDWVIAVATLAVAALFRPVRRRVQDTVDRRFNRKRYDAEHTVETFGARLREQIDIDALGAELVGVVQRTMQPASATIWMRPRT